MSGYNQNGGNGGGDRPVRLPTMRELGRGDIKVVQQKSGPKSPDMRGFFNLDGRLVSVSLWKEPGKQGADGRWMPEYYSGTIQWYQGEVNPAKPRTNGQQQPQQGHNPPQQQPMQYGALPQQHYAPPHQTMPHPHQPQHAPHPQQYPPQQATGYTPDPRYAPQAAPQQAPQGYPPQGGYVPTPSAAPQQAPASGGYAQGYGQQGSTFTRDEIPFSAAK